MIFVYFVLLVFVRVEVFIDVDVEYEIEVRVFVDDGVFWFSECFMFMILELDYVNCDL